MYRTETTAADLAYAIADALAERGLASRAEENLVAEIIAEQLNSRKMDEFDAPEQPKIGISARGVGNVARQWEAEDFRPSNDPGWSPPAPEQKNKILLIKDFRMETGAGLLEAKLAIEQANLDFWKAVELYRSKQIKFF